MSIDQLIPNKPQPPAEPRHGGARLLAALDCVTQTISARYIGPFDSVEAATEYAVLHLTPPYRGIRMKNTKQIMIRQPWQAPALEDRT